MIKEYVVKTDEFVANILGTSMEAQRYDRVGATSNLILIDILTELRLMNEKLSAPKEVAEVVKPVVAEPIIEKGAKIINKGNK